MDIFNTFYQSYLNYIYSYLMKWHIVGACDNCKKYLYANNNYLYIENMENLSLCLQYCYEKCLQTHRNKYNYLNEINFKNKGDDSNHSFNKSSFIHNIKFILKYPETVNLNPPEILKYIIKLRNSNNLSKNDITFLNDVKNYGIA